MYNWLLYSWLVISSIGKVMFANYVKPKFVKYEYFYLKNCGMYLYSIVFLRELK